MSGVPEGSYDLVGGGRELHLHADVQPRYVGVHQVSVLLPFLVEHLRPGLSVVDCGCGVGALTIDLDLPVD